MDKKSEFLILRIPVDLKKKITSKAKAAHKSVSEFVRGVLYKGL